MSAIPSASPSARAAAVAVANRRSGSTAVACANHASKPPGRTTPLLAARALAGSTGPYAALSAKATRLSSSPLSPLSPAQYASPTRKV
ncbi:hypothetical protein BE11_12080 [Sorangium cellulosum]|nr:hypothetical protein BE11_12080 [Sorangium cellulosum]